MSHSRPLSFIWSSEEVWEMCRTEVINLRKVALLAIHMYVFVFLIGCILLCLFFTFGPNFCECTVMSPPKKVELLRVNHPGRRADLQVKLELRWTIERQERKLGTRLPSLLLFLSLSLFPSPPSPHLPLPLIPLLLLPSPSCSSSLSSVFTEHLPCVCTFLGLNTQWQTKQTKYFAFGKLTFQWGRDRQ